MVEGCWVFCRFLIVIVLVVVDLLVVDLMLHCTCISLAFHLHFTCISLAFHRQLFEAMDRDPPHDDGISKDEFIFYYSAYEDYLRDAFAGYCVQDGVNDLNFDIHAAEWYYQNSEGRWQS
jgi:hypothetical protein